jgi:hypothetical protein
MILFIASILVVQETANTCLYITWKSPDSNKTQDWKENISVKCTETTNLLTKDCKIFSETKFIDYSPYFDSSPSVTQIQLNGKYTLVVWKRRMVMKRLIDTCSVVQNQGDQHLKWKSLITEIENNEFSFNIINNLQIPASSFNLSWRKL